MRTSPQAHRDYPATFGDFTAWFRTHEDCRDYLHWLRWPNGFRCPECDGEGWLLNDGRYECEDCHLRTSVTAGTIFDRTRTPLTVWFHACWLFATSKDGISAMALKRQLELGSYQTAWAMLIRLRTATVDPERRKLSGTVEVDETFYGGHTPGQRGGRQLGAKLMIVVAVERNAPKGFGRCRMEIADNARTPTLRRFLLANVEPGSTIVTDGLNSYPGLRRAFTPTSRWSRRGRSRRSTSRQSIAWRRYSSAGCWAPTRVQRAGTTWSSTSTSSSSGSTGALAGTVAWSSSGCWKEQSRTPPCATRTYWWRNDPRR